MEQTLPVSAGGDRVLAWIDDSHVGQLIRHYASKPARSDHDKDQRQSARFAANHAQTGGYGYSVDSNGIARVKIDGVLTPESWAWGDSSETVTDWVAADLAAMKDDPKVRGVLVSINSPGGYVAGAYELADALAAVAAAKPVASFISGYGASAAYLQASQTGHITAYRTALVGSIGTRSAVIDAHAMYERIGAKIIPIDSGGMKSAGLFGTEITADQLEYFRSLVAKQQSFFTEAVATGRRISIDRARELADGRIHVASDAQSLGLIDAIGTETSAYRELSQRAGPGPARTAGTSGASSQATQSTQTETTPAAEATGDPQPAPVAGAESEAPVSQQNSTTPASASVAEIEAACHGASSDFILEQAKKGATVAQAKDAFIGWQAAQLRDRDQQIATQAKQITDLQAEVGTLKAAATQPTGTSKAGVEPVKTKAQESQHNGEASAADRFYAQRDELVARGMTRAAAIQKIAASDPELHAEFIKQSQRK